ncbi:tetratricopeptide repeat protein [Treponema primitia ZAS-2]|uniref:Tetratricopeptide repeat protein n=1 Tax=Treponema primitia (strain ATCC BAA-887 / DSM 12427 / ZAS-2) TaxID=545694 RepID=F5YR24_TREPZ|nr:tetratricopeptide repeat protein [Treponema primitia]AEF85044.1 tetratricopeptide repeat protein [Treponema primitia ZAS-2]
MRLHTALICMIFLLITGPVFSQTGQNAARPDALRSYRIGRDLEARDRMDEANQYYNEAARICLDEISRNSGNMDSYTVLTWTLQRQRKYSDVINWGDRGLRINGNDYRIVETMGEAYFYLDRYEDSLRSMQRYVNSVPQGERTSVAYFFIGEIFRLQRKFYRADIAYTTAVRLDPGSALWWYRLGSVRESVGDLSPAIEAYERALRLNPNYREASEGLERSRRGST